MRAVVDEKLNLSCFELRGDYYFVLRNTISPGSIHFSRPPIIIKYRRDCREDRVKIQIFGAGCLIEH